MYFFSNNYKNNINILNYWSILLFIFWLPLKDDYLPVILALWIFTWLLEGNFKERIQINNKPLYVSLCIYFLLTTIAILYSDNIEYGIFHVQEKLSMVFFPLLLAGSSQKVKQNFKTILLVFVLGNIIASLYCLNSAFINSLVFENGSYTLHTCIGTNSNNLSFWQMVKMRNCHFSYNYLSVFKHPTYFSVYILFSIIILFYLIREGYTMKKWSKILSYCIIVLLIFMLYLLQSRAGIISLAIILILIPIIEIQKKLKKRYLLIIFSTILLFALVILPNSLIISNLTNIRKASIDSQEFSLSNSDTRLQLWYTSIQVIEENFWLGTSPANLTENLTLKYKELGFIDAAKKRLNSHNQFLETFAGLGILGFLSLLSILIYGFVIAIKKHNYLLFFLLLILSFNFLFESMMNRMSGILFMMFFISLLVFANIPSFNKLEINKLTDS